MVQSTKAVLLTCDATLKQFFVQLNESERAFILPGGDVDATHLLVNESSVPWLRERLKGLFDSNTFDVEDKRKKDNRTL